jgi:hypothetical protein
MFRAIRWMFYLLIVLVIVFLYWFLPKYSFIKANPTFCTKLTANIWYCGSGSDLGKIYPPQN